VGINTCVEVYGVKLLGVNAHTGEKFLFSLAMVAIFVAFRVLFHAAARLLVRGFKGERVRFWAHQAINFLSVVILILGLASIWFDNAARATTVMGLIAAGIAFALQKLITAIAGYFVILRGKTFSVGDRIVMGGVRGDVIALDFIQTTILEMGQPPSVSNADPAMWVMARQFTGRIVTVNNGVIFDEPVYNYTRDFPFLFEEMAIGIGYEDKVQTAEAILLDIARTHTVDIQTLSVQAQQHLRDVYDLSLEDVAPRVYYRLTDNWVELSVRFLCKDHGIRALKDAMSRELLRRLNAEKISIASGTYDIVGLPPVRVELATPAPPPQARQQR
jgi:small-conductance mechanosensitive channel